MPVSLISTRIALLTFFASQLLIPCCGSAYAMCRPQSGVNTQSQEHAASNQAPEESSDRLLARMKFLTLILSVGQEDRRYQEAIRNHKDHPVQTDWGKRLGLRKDDADIALRILLDAFYKDRELEKQINILNAGSTSNQTPSVLALRNSLLQEQSKICNEAARNLRYELGQGAFQKLSHDWSISSVESD